MKNLLVYLNPEHKFDIENHVYMEIQIENSLLYWKPEDILVVTNFPYEYKGITAMVLPDELYSGVSRCAIKINVINFLLDYMILWRDITWFHDTEAWQIAPMEVELNRPLGLTDYGWSKKWNGGSMFFKPDAFPIFKKWQKSIEKYDLDDERSLMKLTEVNEDGINDYIQRLNITYNIGKRRVEENIARADKPIRVLHFHPYREGLLKKFEQYLPNNLKELMYAKNINIGK